MQHIMTSKGKTHSINWMMVLASKKNQLVIDLTDERKMSEIAADFERCETIKRTDDATGGAAYEMFEGFSALWPCAAARRTQACASRWEELKEVRLCP